MTKEAPTAKSQLYRISWSYIGIVSLIFMLTSSGWLILGRVTDERTVDRDVQLRRQVGQIWGGVHHQVAPSIDLDPVPPPPPPPRPQAVKETKTPEKLAKTPEKLAKTPEKDVQPATSQDAATSKKTVAEPQPPPPECLNKYSLSPQKTVAKVHLDLEHRRKGLLWYSTYAVRFAGSYRFKSESSCARDAVLIVPLPARHAVYDEFSVELDGKEATVQFVDKPSRAARVHLAAIEPGSVHEVRLRYRSRGLDRWNYAFGRSTSRGRDFKLAVVTSFDKVDFPTGTLSPTRKRAKGAGWLLEWRFNNLLSDSSIAVTMPQKLNPGPLASEISLFAPVSLLFFFGVLLLVAVIKQVKIHPVHFAMLAGAFFAFHLLFAYLVDHAPIWLAFSISSVTSVGLVVSYLRLAVGRRFALLWAGGAQMLYLVLFSLAFCWEGYTGLTITIFSILTLFVVMQLTARIDWFAKFAKDPPPEDTHQPPYPSGSAKRAFHEVR